MINNIILITFIIILFFFVSNDKKISDLITTKNIKYLLLLIIIYFVYQNYNIILLVILILLFIFLNIENNKYIDKYESFKNLIIDYINKFDQTTKLNKMNKSNTKLNNIDTKLNNIEKKNIEEKFTNDIKLEDYDFNPVTLENIDILKDDKDKNISIEPFKEEVTKLKDLYENIKLEIKKLG
jgi:hypothetical protein